ncbi:MAG: hypothetical protein QG584_1967, partial [Pseudomonadota bacterium]|nr:hypothetical protein [Pseudomonadota bacterium]
MLFIKKLTSTLVLAAAMATASTSALALEYP